MQVPKIEIVPNSTAESDSEIDVLSVGNVLSNIPNIIYVKKTQLTLTPLVCMNLDSCVRNKVYTCFEKGEDSTMVASFFLICYLLKLRLLKQIGTVF